MEIVKINISSNGRQKYNKFHYDTVTHTTGAPFCIYFAYTLDGAPANYESHQLPVMYSGCSKYHKYLF